MYKIIYENGKPCIEEVKLTKEEAVKLHRDMWNWIAEQIEFYDNPSEVIYMLKCKYLYSNGYIDVDKECFCCEYVRQHSKGICDTCCPFNWTSRKRFTKCMGGYYRLIITVPDKNKSYRLALKIANLPVRTDI